MKRVAAVLAWVVASGAAAQAPPVVMPPLAQMEGVGEGLRISLVAALRAPDYVSNGEPMAAFVGLSKYERLLLASFLSQSAQRTHLAGNRAIVGWWNPFVDGWMVTRWTLGAEGWRLDGAGYAAGEASWRPTVLALAVALSDHAGHAARDFDSRAAADGFAPAMRANSMLAARALLLRRQDSMRNQLAADSIYRLHAQAIRRALVTETHAQSGHPAIRAWLQRLPSEFRLALRPAAAFARPDGVSYAVQSAIDPSLVILVHFAGDSLPARIEPIRLGL